MKSKPGQYGDWYSYKQGDPKSFFEALTRVTETLINFVAKYGKLENVQWIINADRLMYRPNELRPDHDASIGWKGDYRTELKDEPLLLKEGVCPPVSGSSPARPAGQ